jgi:hypothetical protein
MPNLRKLSSSHSDWNGEYLETNAADTVNDEVLTGEVLSPNELSAPASVKRLVVLVPDQVIGEGRLAKRIWLLASARRLDILLVTKVSDSTYEMAARRQLASLASSLYDAWFKVDVKVVYQDSWVDALHEVIQLGDMIVCHSEQISPYGKLRDRSLKLVLAEEFSNPVFLLSGFSEQEKPLSIIRWPKQAIAWGGFLLILVVFSLIEFRIDQLVTGTLGQLLLIVILIVEFGLIWFLNTITN